MSHKGEGTQPIRDSWESLLKSDDSLRLSGYTSWQQVAGYFDGDGSVTCYPGKWTIAFYLEWADQCRVQLEQLNFFMFRMGIKTGRVHKLSASEGCITRICEVPSVVETADRMLPHSFKKREELQLIIDYRQRGIITGDEVIRKLNDLVQTGKRERHRPPRRSIMPWTFEDGLHMSKQRGGRMNKDKGRVLTDEQVASIREKRKLFGLTFSQLAQMFGVSRDTIRRSIDSE